MQKCDWCGKLHEKQLGLFDYCSRACQEAARSNSKQKWANFSGGFVNTIQNQVQIEQLNQQQELTARQNSLIAEQNQRLAAEEAERRLAEAVANRIAAWKQFMFDVNQGLDYLSEEGDEVAMLAQAECFQVKCVESGFSEVDLSEISDKRYFADTHRRVETVWAQANEKSRTNYEQFKTLYREYREAYAERSVFPQAETEEFQRKLLLKDFSKPKPKQKELSDKQLNTLIKPPQELLELRKKGELYFWGIVGVMACNLCLPGIALLPAACIYFFGLKPLKLARQPLEEKFQQNLEEAKQEWLAQRDAKHQRATDHWERERRNHKERLPKANREIEEHNRTLQERFDVAQSKWVKRKKKLIQTINDYIDRHPELQTWFPRPDLKDVSQ
ncbi:hypothetical protein [Rubinisphaera brasiliensis]|uniref:Uncharacterized protein n=1 Tax=Rubinisphaera brasiliensis (strain ATCC 49424 / DSM 5305 / JCM 21570 / IAM 15109 / NBRC 103401 / IFAM 1448) TaxID=756272 RepID=F0SJ11_RUBBR|nr:hypothetical protein [Rubinisphaera brasiliensis]ADY58553.1 hypothetical protein Plabr_0932 [Rubinisphaera brasiliensis DSM 5305]